MVGAVAAAAALLSLISFLFLRCCRRCCCCCGGSGGSCGGRRLSVRSGGQPSLSLLIEPCPARQAARYQLGRRVFGPVSSPLFWWLAAYPARAEFSMAGVHPRRMSGSSRLLNGRRARAAVANRRAMDRVADAGQQYWSKTVYWSRILVKTDAGQGYWSKIRIVIKTDTGQKDE